MRSKISKKEALKKQAEELEEARAKVEVEAEFGTPGRRMTAAERKAWAAWDEKDRRARYGKLPKPPEEGDVEVLYAKLHDELRHLNDGELVMTVLKRPT